MVEPLRHRQTKEAETDMFYLKPPRHISTYMSAPLSRGISVTFSDLDRLLVTDLGARSSPAAAKRCAKGAGLEGAPKSVTSSKISQIFPSFVWSFFRSKASPLRACGTRRTNLYPAGYNPFQGPSCALRGLGLQGGWDHSLPRRLSAMSKSGHTSTLDFISSCYRYLIVVRHPLSTAPCGTTPVSR
jgi:hypothetical protein